jgi:transglutaminase-like putative cysteine protease
VRLAIDHVTHYVYDAPLRHSTQYLRLKPRSNPRQRVIEWTVETPGTPVETVDGYGNVLHVLTLDEPVSEIHIRAAGVIETSAAAEARDDAGTPGLSPLLFLRPTARTRADAAIAGFAEDFRRCAGTLPGLRELAAAIRRRLPFRPGATDVHSTAAQAFAEGNGVCQDHAHVFIACCRHLGVPARYVSGYIHSPGYADEHVSSHAWAEAWVVDRWRSFDVTNDGVAGEHHIQVAIGADYLDACPVRGVRKGGGAESMRATALVSPHAAAGQ